MIMPVASVHDLLQPEPRRRATQVLLLLARVCDVLNSAAADEPLS